MPKASTAAERAAAVDKEMDAALAEMDEILLKEKKTQARERSAAMSAPAASSGGRSASGGASDGGTSAGGGANTTGDSGSATTGEHNASGSPQKSDAEKSESEKRRTPPDIPDGRDDDIVARQLREAAVNEDDPALREKLWDEYRKYKSGQK